MIAGCKARSKGAFWWIIPDSLQSTATPHPALGLQATGWTEGVEPCWWPQKWRIGTVSPLRRILVMPAQKPSWRLFNQVNLLLISCLLCVGQFWIWSFSVWWRLQPGIIFESGASRWTRMPEANRRRSVNFAASGRPLWTSDNKWWGSVDNVEIWPFGCHSTRVAASGQVQRQEQITSLIKENSSAKTELIRMHEEVGIFSLMPHFKTFKMDKSSMINLTVLVLATGLSEEQVVAPVPRCHRCC